MVLDMTLGAAGKISSLLPNILINKIEEPAMALNLSDSSNAIGVGKRLNGFQYQTKEVKVTFQVRIGTGSKLERMQLRNSTIAQLSAYLDAAEYIEVPYRNCPYRSNSQTLYRPMRLYGRCSAFPDAGNLLTYDNQYTFTYRSYGVPFWQDSEEITVKELRIIGDYNIAPTPLSIHREAVSSRTWTKYSIGSDFMRFERLGSGSAKMIDITYDHYGLMSVTKTVGTTVTDIMGNRTVASADDLWVTSANAATFEAKYETAGGEFTMDTGDISLLRRFW